MGSRHESLFPGKSDHYISSNVETNIFIILATAMSDTGKKRLKAKVVVEKNTESRSETEAGSFFNRCYGTVKHFIWTVLYDPEILSPICVLLFLLEAMLLELIICKVPYTEIDYSTYMQQIDQIERGQLDYNKIKGDTGPIVYPGGYVFIYSWMKVITDGMNNLARGQEFFRLLYLVSLALTFLIYIQASGVKKVKPYQLYLLVLSKRLHSIYVLRLFNDCFATFFVLGTIFLLQVAAKFKCRSYLDKDPEVRSEMALYSNLVTLLAVDSYCFGVSVKMNALLYLPGLVIILYFLNDENLLKMLGMVIFGVVVEIGINFQFLTHGDKIRANFFKNAFDFSRQFMFKWTVNWRFLGEDIFLSKWFHSLLLALHVSVLLFFTFAKWLRKSETGKDLSDLIFRDGLVKFYKNTISTSHAILDPARSGRYIALIMMTSNLVGVLFARSLHYQFLSWYYYSIPFLLGETGLPLAVNVFLVAVHEWSWNAYPSTAASSISLVCIISSIVILLFLHFTTPSEANKQKHE